MKRVIISERQISKFPTEIRTVRSTLYKFNYKKNQQCGITIYFSTLFFNWWLTKLTDDWSGKEGFHKLMWLHIIHTHTTQSNCVSWRVSALGIVVSIPGRVCLELRTGWRNISRIFSTRSSHDICKTNQISSHY